MVMLRPAVRCIFFEKTSKGYQATDVNSDFGYLQFNTAKELINYALLIVDRPGLKLVWKIQGMASDFKVYRQAIKMRRHYESLWMAKQKHVTDIEKMLYNKWDGREICHTLKKEITARGPDLSDAGWEAAHCSR